MGVDAVIDAVGVDAQRPQSGPAADRSAEQADQFAAQVQQVAPSTNVQGGNWVPGDAPSQAAQWSVESVAKNGWIGIIGVGSTPCPPGGAAMSSPNRKKLRRHCRMPHKGGQEMLIAPAGWWHICTSAQRRTQGHSG